MLVVLYSTGGNCDDGAVTLSGAWGEMAEAFRGGVRRDGQRRRDNAYWRYRGVLQTGAQEGMLLTSGEVFCKTCLL